MQRVKLKVHGMVQGVFFRATTVDFAGNLGLMGYAKNLDDGTVEIVAEGEKDTISKLIEFCHEGPKMAKVSKVEVFYSQPREEFSDFSIRS